jgi:hypothetical protein
MPPRTAGFGNQDRVELNGMIGLHRPQNHRASGMLPVAQHNDNVALNGCIPLQPESARFDGGQY